MTYIKRMVMQGFKSFAKKTEIIFDKGINVIVGPNGSGKSNISDALCFALGRLSIKSMRAAKAKNLLFMGSKYAKPSREATVELVFDNTDRVFAIEKDEVCLQRTVRYNGQSIYKINGEVKTRLEVIEALGQAGIDPYGFNLILQGKIQEIVKMHPLERRKIIEDVAGIGLYESRKEKSLKELEKTEERLKEINSILRERTAYLKNLDRERSQALRFKELELTIKRANATLLTKKKHEKEKELENLQKSEDEKSEYKEKLKEECSKIQASINKIEEEINQINRHIQHATGLEQESLHTHIANLRAEIEGLKVRKEGYENRKKEIERRVSEMQKTLPELEEEIRHLKEESPMMAKKAQELKAKKEELALLEEEKKRILSIKSELNSLREKSRDKEQRLGRIMAESDSLIKQLEEYQKTLNYKNDEECDKVLKELRKKLVENKNEIEQLNKEMINCEKRISVAESETEKAVNIEVEIKKIDVCPLCRSKITSEHIEHVIDEQEKILNESKIIIEENKKILDEIVAKKIKLLEEIKEIESKIKATEAEHLKNLSIKEKQEQLKKIVEEERILRNEIILIEKKIKECEEKSQNYSLVEEKYESKILEIEEISARTIENIDNTLLYKQRDVEQILSTIKISQKSIEELRENIAEYTKKYEIKIKQLDEKEKQEKELQTKFKKMFDERERAQAQIQENNLKLNELNNNLRAIEEQINYLKIGKAKLEAEKEAIMMELNDFSGVELLQGSQSAIEEKLQKAKQAINEIGSINLKALEVFDEVKKEYDLVQEKTNTIQKEKEDILAIIAEIDAKKKRSFMKTFRAMNDLFSQNFSQLSVKGTAFLELENRENIFEGGVNIEVRLSKGKYFDVTSLSGGEQTLVALSLLFAIQEYKPYHFYVLDEIDAALDKRNSERLAGLLVKYMKDGQYIVVTHNDALIMQANVLYGISMHDGVSKVLSLNLDESLKAAREIQAQEAQKEAEDAQKRANEVMEKLEQG